MYLIEKDEMGKYNFPDALSLKTKGYQWYIKNNCGEGGKILKVKNLESKYLVSRDFNLGEVTGLWAVTSSGSDGSRLQDRARERLINRACPSSTTFDGYVSMRTSCWLIEQRDGDYFCDCFEGCKGKLCPHSNGMRYIEGDLVPEADVRAVPLGGKRKRGRPKRNPMCLTRSPPMSHESSSTLRHETVEDENFLDHPEDSEMRNSSTDLHLELESDTDEDDDVVSSGLGNPKPPKKTRRIESLSLEIQLPEATSSDASAMTRGTSRGRAGGRGRPRSIKEGCPILDTEQPLVTSSRKRRGRPRGSARGGSEAPPPASATGTRGRPRGSARGGSEAPPPASATGTSGRPRGSARGGTEAPPPSSGTGTRGRPRGSARGGTEAPPPSSGTGTRGRPRGATRGTTSGRPRGV